jgi:predicted PolB exonuclease-like 3'-5' exonuclease
MISHFEEGGQATDLPKDHAVVIFDIETGPAPAEVIDAHMPEFEAPSNYKDPAKIEAALAEKRAAFATKAALSPSTGRVLAIGAWIDGEYQSAIVTPGSGEEEEASVIRWFWDRVGRHTILVGWNSNRFDLPFLIKRSWALGIDAPVIISPGGRFDGRTCWDLMERWGFGDKNSFASLDSVARYLGVGEKSGNGEFFHQVLKAFPEEAAEYLRNDVRLTFGVAKKMGVLKDEAQFELPTAATPEPAAASVEDY